MKIIWIVASMLLSFPLFGKNIELKVITTRIKGDKVQKASSHMVTKVGQELTLPFKNLSDLKVTILPDDKIGPAESVFLNSKVYEIKNDQETLLSNPKIIALLGKSATVTTESSTGEYLEIKIVPVKYSH